jgi:glycine dehydrogenase subunit 1
LRVNQQPVPEYELGRHLEYLSNATAAAQDYMTYIGAGNYEHFIPESVRYLLSRSEFSTAYTPYQPEISQGTLQAIYEYQTLVERLLGMEVSNASLYDGASALAEALLMAIRVTRKTRVVLSSLVHPHYRHVMRTYFAPTGYEIVELPYLADGRTDPAQLAPIDDLAAVAVQSPNFFGVIEDLKSFGEKTRAKEALFIVNFTEPLAYGMLRPPGSFGADIVCGEGQSLGIAQSFGGQNCGCRGARRIRPDARHARAAYPPRKGDLEHLHQQQPLCAGGGNIYGLARRQGFSGTRPTES